MKDAEVTKSTPPAATPRDWRSAETARLNDETRRLIHPNATVCLTGKLNHFLKGNYETEAEAQINLAEHTRGLMDTINTTPIEPGENPHLENDFGAVSYLGERIFWKIDYYANDGKMTSGSEAPWDASKTHRVMTIMFASDY